MKNRDCVPIYFKAQKRSVLPGSIRLMRSKYQRIIVRGDYKVLYKEEAGVIKIVDVVSVRQSPEVLKNR
jgi:hypothetical protein